MYKPAATGFPHKRCGRTPILTPLQDVRSNLAFPDVSSLAIIFWPLSDEKGTFSDTTIIFRMLAEKGLSQTASRDVRI